MVTRLSPQDSVFYYQDDRGASSQVGSLLIVDRREGGLDYQELLRTVESRLQLVPRYRKLIREITLGLGRPVWVDDAEFDITYHVRRSALPEPGSDEQLHDLVARLMSRPLEPGRPLWEMYLVEGLRENRLAVLTKTHRSLVSGHDALEINQVIVDDARQPSELPEDLWLPAREPGRAELMVGAVGDALVRPLEMLDRVRASSGPVGAVGGLVADSARRVGSVMQLATGTAPRSPLNGSTTGTSLFTVATCSGADASEVAEQFGCSVSDVLLATIAGALRRWLLSRDQTLDQTVSVRALVPLKAFPENVPPARETEWAAGGLQGFVTDLPVGEPNALVRLSQVAQLTQRHARSPRRMSSGSAESWLNYEVGPATFHAMSARAAASMSRRSFNLPITIARGPVSPQYLAGNRIAAIVPVPVRVPDRALSVGVTTYDGEIHFGFNADRTAMWDLGVMTDYLTESFDELVAGARK
ncbi:wax ester/triacylglycerol synthase family O-acyltransferase [Jongsikchunia kroppenstedtii]|uniref:wax ester/triacylglycerol synthase family O-acyltransferase n=1 Tax=Jongsikchunia kroppenstedtii TaxID=1121721 RepID=UPI00039E43AB|nr:wax ester/triacylglycerol synthase family O-acyltransferase [Jongsikchunia kroppenstedtii]